MTDVTIITDQASAPASVGESEPVVEAVAEAAPEVAAEQTEQVETVSEAAVEIAIVEAERDITIAEISADAHTAAIEAQTNQELEQCRTRIAELETENAGLREQASLALLTPPPSSETTLQESPPPNPDVESAETLASPEQAQDPVEPPKKVKRLRWI